MATPTETEIQEKVRSLSKGSTRLFRNNNGVAKTSNGCVVRFGLGNGTSDLIGWESVEITPDMVGQRIAVFLAPEIKTEKEYNYVMKHYDELLNYSGSDAKKLHLKQQIKFVELVKAMGGRAGFACSIEQAEKIKNNTN